MASFSLGRRPTLVILQCGRVEDKLSEWEEGRGGLERDDPMGQPSHQLTSIAVAHSLCLPKHCLEPMLRGDQSQLQRAFFVCSVGEMESDERKGWHSSADPIVGQNGTKAGDDELSGNGPKAMVTRSPTFVLAKLCFECQEKGMKKDEEKNLFWLASQNCKNATCQIFHLRKDKLTIGSPRMIHCFWWQTANGKGHLDE